MKSQKMHYKAKQSKVRYSISHHEVASCGHRPWSKAKEENKRSRRG